MSENLIKNMDFGTAVKLKNIVEYAEGRVKSKTLVNKKGLSLTFFAFDKGEGLSTHSAPGDAMVLALEGSVNIVIGDNPAIILKEGETVVMPASIPHSLDAVERFKMMLVLVKPENSEETGNCCCGNV